MWGTLRRTCSPSASSVAARSLRAEFLAPPIRTVPESGGPGRTTKRSMAVSMVDADAAQARCPEGDSPDGRLSRASMTRVVIEAVVDRHTAARVAAPRDGYLADRLAGDGESFEAGVGPWRHYRRPGDG